MSFGTPVGTTNPFQDTDSYFGTPDSATVGMRAEALPGQRAGLLRILPIRLEQEATLVSFVCRKALVNMPPLPRVRAAVAESCRKAGLPVARSPRQ